MKRNIDINEISDGKLYGANDMVKADCGDCKGCSACCQGMGESIVLDLFDVYRLITGLGVSFEALLGSKLELNVFDGMILPHLKMAGEKEACAFLNQEGRCSVHPYRPGICRLFPLGRIYEDGGFKYFLQVHECKNENRTKVKVKKWIDTPDLKQNDEFIMLWHDFVNETQAKLMKAGDEDLFKKVNMFLLQSFYMEAYQEEDFYKQFKERLEKSRAVVNMLIK
jgi:Fe-S-cluster containining protein